MSNVSFLRGLHSKLPAAGSAINGAFYLTTDSHRLYVGDENKNLIDLNKYIITVASVEALNGVSAQEGDFYYAEKENALVLRKSNSWKLINPDTNNIIETASATYTISAESDKATVKYEYAVVDNRDISVQASDSFTITAGDNINITASGKDIVIDGAKYDMSVSTNSNNGTVTLTLGNDHDSSTSSATFKAGANVTLAKDAEGNIVIASSYENTTNKSAAINLNTDNTLQFVIVDSDNNPITSTKSPVLAYKVNGTTVDLGTELPVYSKTQIDSKLNDLNGMTYKGTVGEGGSAGSTLPTSNVKSGDTYLVVGSSGVNYGAGTANKGDLLIATGTESNGVLSSITWTYVPSGDDAERDTTYRFNVDASTNKVTLLDSIDSGTAVGSLTLDVEDNGMLSVSSTGSGENLTTTFSHNKVTQSNTTSDTNAASNFTAVKAVSVDAYGHITGVETSTYTLPTYSITGSSSVVDNVGTLKTVLLKDSENVGEVNFDIDSTSLRLVNKADNNGLIIDMVWGDF